MIKSALLLNVVICLGLCAQSFFSTDSTLIIKKENNHQFEFQITRTLFDSINHDISNIQNNEIDGKRASGITWSIPKYEIKNIRLRIDNVELQIPKVIYGFCFNPNLSKEYLNAYWGKDYESVFVFMTGGDGVGGYTIAWYLSKNGNHSYMIPRYDDFMFNTQW